MSGERVLPVSISADLYKTTDLPGFGSWKREFKSGLLIQASDKTKPGVMTRAFMNFQFQAEVVAELRCS